jgi:polyisoprenyl-phosphate glycosyltransferase
MTLKLIQPDAPSPARLGPGTVVSIVIPCFNEEVVLPMLFERLREVLRDWTCRYEVLFVDDGSTDATWDLLSDCHRRDPRWKAIRLSRNFGHQLALWTGLHQSTGDVVAVLDADLQDPPELLDQFLAKWSEGYDVVFAVRRKRKEGLLKRLAYFTYYRVLGWLSEVDIPLDSGDFAIMDRRVLDALAHCKEQEPFVRGLRAWVGFRQVGLPYERPARAAGEVKYTFRKLTKLALNGIFSFSTRPLRLATWCGVGISLVAFLGVAFTVLQRLFAPQFAQLGLPFIPGFTTTVTAILFLGGIQLICLGILGEYVGRIFLEVKGRPLTIIANSHGLQPQQAAKRRAG